MSSSTSAIVSHAKSGKRHEIRDKALVAVANHPGSTSTEIAGFVLESQGLNFQALTMGKFLKLAGVVASVQKRVSDLVDLGYIKKSGSRECNMSGHVVTIYEVTDKGRDYLRGVGGYRAVPAKPAAPKPSLANSKAGRSALAGLRSSLN